MKIGRPRTIEIPRTEADLSRWAETRLSRWAKDYREAHQVMTETEEDERYEDEMREVQISFMTEYVAHIMTPGPTVRWRFRRARRFLALQSGNHRGAALELRFYSPRHPYGAEVYVRDKSDVDIADVCGIVDTDSLNVRHRDGRRWRLAEAKRFLLEVIHDLEFDGFDPKLGFKISGDRMEICGDWDL